MLSSKSGQFGQITHKSKKYHNGSALVQNVNTFNFGENTPLIIRHSSPLILGQTGTILFINIHYEVIT